MPPSARDYDLEAERVLFLVATSHLDSQWRWTIRETIRRFLPATLRENFARFEKFPSYVLSFEGAFRYMLIREYYPEEFQRLKAWVAAGRWYPAGGMLEAPDVNVVSPESLLRHILYGNGFFQRQLGRRSRDLFLPDCFGFGHALPSIAAHCGLVGFSSSKLVRWIGPAQRPFDLGTWIGPDGSRVVAAINPDGYGAGIDEDLPRARRWIEAIDRLGRAAGIYAGLKYFGVGDRGGAPDEATLARLEGHLREPGEIRVVTGPSERLFLELTPEQADRLPAHRGELLLPTHGTGCYTSQAALKAWNRGNELLAQAAEGAAVVAAWLGGPPYPRERLEAAWIRFLWHQMHDDLTGTSIPAAYEITWNDEAVAANLLTSLLTEAVGAVAGGLDTRAAGVPLVVYNPLPIPREDPVEARIELPRGLPGVRAFGPDGREVPAQLLDTEGAAARILFLARVPALGFAVYDLRPAPRPANPPGELAVGENTLENRRYRVELGAAGDLVRVLDKGAGREVLAAPLRLELLHDRSRRWPAWEVLYRDVAAPPAEAAGPGTVRVAEAGPARVALEVHRRAGASRITLALRLAAGGAGDRLELAGRVDWRSRGRLLKAAFPLSVSSPLATYDLGWGTIQRRTARPEEYEVPAQQWADLTAADGSYGVAVLSASGYGWDRPDGGTLRLSLLRSPAAWRRFRHQATQDHGRHRLLFALHGHAGDWRQGQTAWQAARLNQPLRAFRTRGHPGDLGRSFSFLELSDPRIAVRALKGAEAGGEAILRLQEAAGAGIRGAAVAFAAPLRGAREVDGAEEPRGPARVEGGALRLDFGPFQPRTFALRLGEPPCRLGGPRWTPVALPFDGEATSFHGHPRSGDFDGRGHTLPGELLPPALARGGIELRLGPLEPGALNAVSCRGQEIPLPGGYRRLHLLAAAADGDVRATFEVGGRSVPLRIQAYAEPIARRNRWRRRLGVGPWRFQPGLLKGDPIAWLGTHRHDPELRDEPYLFCYLFEYRLDLPPGGGILRLPESPGIRILAATAAEAAAGDTAPAAPCGQPGGTP